MNDVPKYINDGKVAVLISPGFGAGWSTWAHEDTLAEQLLYDPDIVQMVLDGKSYDELEKFVEEKYADTYVYTGGLYDIEVRWLDVGTKFRVTEYDGSEGIMMQEYIFWYEA